MAVYTKKGDKGETGLFAGPGEKPRRLPKSSLIINAIGAIDEVNSYLGVISSTAGNIKIINIINVIQRDLFTIGSILAGADLKLQRDRVTKLEREIDEMEKKLPVLTGFIIPGGSILSARLQFARSLVRRAERVITALPLSDYPLPDIRVYINRLSDYLFTLARWVNLKAKVSEIKWKDSDP